MGVPKFCRNSAPNQGAPDAVTAARHLIALAIEHQVVRDTPALQREIARDPIAVAQAILIRGAAHVAEAEIRSRAERSPPPPQPIDEQPQDDAADPCAPGAVFQHGDLGA